MSSTSPSVQSIEVSSWPLDNPFRWFVSLMILHEAGRWARHEVEYHQLSSTLEWNLMRDVHDALRGSWPEVAAVFIHFDGTDEFGIRNEELRFKKRTGALEIRGTVSTDALLRYDVPHRVRLVLAFAVHTLVLALGARRCDFGAMAELRDRLIDEAGRARWLELGIPEVST
jgi:hypothetical protein